MLCLRSQNLTQMSIFDLKIFNLPLNNYSSFDQARFLRLFLFLKVKSDHFSRFYGHFSDFSLVCRIMRTCQNNEIAIESSKMLG